MAAMMTVRVGCRSGGWHLGHPEKKGAAHGERPKSREETPKEGSGRASRTAPHQYEPAGLCHQATCLVIV